jgi:hypothetical protein
MNSTNTAMKLILLVSMLLLAACVGAPPTPAPPAGSCDTPPSATVHAQAEPFGMCVER